MHSQTCCGSRSMLPLLLQGLAAVCCKKRELSSSNSRDLGQLTEETIYIYIAIWGTRKIGDNYRIIYIAITCPHDPWTQKFSLRWTSAQVTQIFGALTLWPSWKVVLQDISRARLTLFGNIRFSPQWRTAFGKPYWTTQKCSPTMRCFSTSWVRCDFLLVRRDYMGLFICVEVSLQNFVW